MSDHAVAHRDEHLLGAPRRETQEVAVAAIAARMPSVLSALMLVAELDLAAASYARVVPYFAGRLVERPLPFDVPRFELHLLWHPRETSDPFQRWLREDLLTHAASLPRGRVTPRPRIDRRA